jgi:hypothetical protein
VPENVPEPGYLPTDDLDAGLRDRLRHARDQAYLTREELLELADALAEQRRALAGALADLARREAEATAMRDALERTSREAAEELDERDARLAALAEELMLERSQLERRERDLLAAERRAHEPASRDEPDTGRLEAMEALVHELRDRLERVETTLAARLGRVVEVVEEIARGVRAPLERAVAAVHGQPERPHEAPPDPAATSDASPPAAAGPSEAHLLFVTTPAGYRLFERSGPPPAPGTRFSLGTVAGEELSGSELEAGALRCSPLPHDARPCVACTIAAPADSGDAEAVG